MPSILRLLSAVLLLSCAPAHPDAPRPPAPATPPPTSTATTSIGDEIVVRTNAERAKLGLAALAPNEKLMRAARLHAIQMASARKMAHELPGAEYPKLSSRLAAVSYNMLASGENIAEGYPTAAAVVAGWMTSPSHRENIVSPRYSEMGAAISTASNGRPFYVQVFGRPASR